MRGREVHFGAAALKERLVPLGADEPIRRYPDERLFVRTAKTGGTAEALLRPEHGARSFFVDLHVEGEK